MRRAALVAALLFAGCAAPAAPVTGPETGPRFDGQPLSHWVEQMRDLSPARKREAAIALRYFGAAAAPAIPGLIDALRFDGSKKEAEDALEAIGPASIPHLIDAMATSPDPDVRDECAFLLSVLAEDGVRSPEILAALGRALDDLEGGAAWAASAMKYYGADAGPYVPKLEALSHGEGYPAKYARESLERLKAGK